MDYIVLQAISRGELRQSPLFTIGQA